MLGLHLDLGKIRAYGSAYLASILYQTELGDFVYQKDGSSNMVLSNQASLGYPYNGQLHSGRGIELGATNDVDIPIHHTLGSDVYSSMSSPTGLTVLDPNISSAGGGSTNGGILYLETSAIDIDAICLVSMTVTNTTGTPYINGYHDGTTSVLFDTPVLVLDGTIEIEVENRLETRIQLYMNNTTIWSFDTTTTIKQITNPNSYLTYYDFTDGLITLGNSVDGGSSVEQYDGNIKEPANGGTWTDNLDGTYTVIGNGSVGVGARDNSVDYILSGDIGKTYNIKGTSISGQLFFAVYDSAYTLIANGENNVVFKATTVPMRLYIYTGASGEVTYRDISVKEILPISTKYTLNTKTVNNFLTHTTPWSASDWTRINNNPNLIGKLALETTGATKTISELDMVMDAGASADSYYMCSEKSGAYLVDSRVAYGVDRYNSSADVGTNTGTTLTASSYTVTGTDTVGTIIHQIIASSGYSDGDIVKVTLNLSNVTGTPVVSIYSGYTNPIYDGTVLKNGDNSFLLKFSDGRTQASFSFDTTVGAFSYNYTTTMEKVTSIPIANYAETVRTNADLQQKGIQTTAFVADSAGTPLSYTSNILNYDANSYTDTQWNPSLESTFWIEEVIDGVVYQHKYDGTNLTTYTDNVAGTPALHSPENANYLSGKGVYPKVTADPYTAYQCKYFSVLNGNQYANYDQTARYAILAAM